MWTKEDVKEGFVVETNGIDEDSRRRVVNKLIKCGVGRGEGYVYSHRNWEYIGVRNNDVHYNGSINIFGENPKLVPYDEFMNGPDTVSKSEGTTNDELPQPLPAQFHTDQATSKLQQLMDNQNLWNSCPESCDVAVQDLDGEIKFTKSSCKVSRIGGTWSSNGCSNGYLKSFGGSIRRYDRVEGDTDYDYIAVKPDSVETQNEQKEPTQEELPMTNLVNRLKEIDNEISKLYEERDSIRKSIEEELGDVCELNWKDSVTEEGETSNDEIVVTEDVRNNPEKYLSVGDRIEIIKASHGDDYDVSHKFAGESTIRCFASGCESMWLKVTDQNNESGDPWPCLGDGSIIKIINKAS